MTKGASPRQFYSFDVLATAAGTAGPVRPTQLRRLCGLVSIFVEACDQQPQG